MAACVLRLFPTVPWFGLWSVILAFPGHSHLLLMLDCTDFEACIGVLGLQDICRFTSRDMGCYPFYFQGYGILCSIFCSLSRILLI